jgi:exodeoxyribonuclease V gamma subunit
MGVSLEVLNADVWPDREPMEAKADRRERIERKLLFEALDSGASGIPVAPPDWLGKSGALAAGVVGAQAYVRARDCADAVLRAARAALGDAFERVPVPIDLDLGGGLRLTGELERVYRSVDGQRILFDAKPGGTAGFAELLPFYIDWAALRLTCGAGVRANFVEYAANSTSSTRTPELMAVILEQDETLLRAGLRRLIQTAQAAGTQGFLFPAKTAWDWAKAAAGKRHAAAHTAWQGNEFAGAGERSYAPGYAGLLGRDLDFGDASSPAYARFAAAAELVCEVLDPERRVLLRPASEPAGRKA